MIPFRWPNHLKGPKALRPKTGATEGGSVLEFALVAPMLFMVILACMELALLLNAEMTLQYAVRTAGRYAITGNHLADPKHPGQSLSRIASITQVAQQAALGLNVSGISISSSAGGNGNAGGPGDTVTISLTTSMPINTPLVAQFFKNGNYTNTASVSFKNEPFPPANTL